MKDAKSNSFHKNILKRGDPSIAAATKEVWSYPQRPRYLQPQQLRGKVNTLCLSTIKPDMGEIVTYFRMLCALAAGSFQTIKPSSSHLGRYSFTPYVHAERASEIKYRTNAHWVLLLLTYRFSLQLSCNSSGRYHSHARGTRSWVVGFQLGARTSEMNFRDEQNARNWCSCIAHISAR